MKRKEVWYHCIYGTQYLMPEGNRHGARENEQSTQHISCIIQKSKPEYGLSIPLSNCCRFVLKQHRTATIILTAQHAILSNHLHKELQETANLCLPKLYCDLVERICCTVQHAHNVGNHKLSVNYV